MLNNSKGDVVKISGEGDSGVAQNLVDSWRRLNYSEQVIEICRLTPLVKNIIAKESISFAPAPST